jgi:hypothetical protein
MPDRKYTYQIEIDAAQAKQAAAQLRALFEKELRITAPAGAAQEIARSAAPAAELAAEMQKIAKIDLTKPVDELQREISSTAQQLDRLRAQYERLSTTGMQGGRSGAEAASYQAYVEEVRRMVSDRAASAIASTGQYLNVGQRNAQFVHEHEDTYLDFAKDYHSKNRDVEGRARQSIQEREQLARLEVEMYEAQLQITQAERTIAERRMADAERRMAALGGMLNVDDNDPTLAAFREANEEIDRLSEEQQQWITAIANANENLSRITAENQAEIAKAEQAAARKRGELATAAPAAGATAYTQQTAITVNKNSVDRAKELTEQLRESAGLTERIAANTQKITEAEIGRTKSAKEAYVAQEQERRLTEEAIRDAERRKNVETEAAKAQTEAARAATEQAKQANNAAQQQKIAQQGVTATTKAEATVRTQSARAEATVTIEAARTAGAAAREEQKRQTMALRDQINQRTQMQRQAARQTSTGGSGTFFGMTPGMMAGSALAAVGVYSVDQTARAIYQGARLGAQAERTAVTFEQVSRRVGVSADAMVRAVREASRNTITDMDAMSIGAQILAQKWSSSSKDIVGDTADLVAASRRLAQIYTDEQGQFLTTQEVFARLVKFVREGNKELVDQFGLSNQRIADALGITVKGLASATGSADRFRGLIKVLKEDMDRLGPAMLTTADKFEQSEARITAAKLRIDKALAGPVAGLTEGTAGVLEGLQIRSGAQDVNMIREFLQQRAESYNSQNLPQPTEIANLIKLFDQLDAATGLSADSARDFSTTLAAMSAEILNNNGATAAQLAEMQRLERVIALAATGADAYSRVMAITTREALEQDATIFALARTMGDYQRLYEDGEISLERYNRLSGQLATTLFNLARAAGTLAPALAAVNTQLAAAPQNPGLLGGAIMGTGAAASPSWFKLRQDEDAFRQDRINAQRDRDAAAREEAKREQERIANEAQREWEAAAKAAQSEWEAAAKATADEFKSALEAVPGLFGTSSVTEQDMALAEAGVYQQKPDEYLRRLRDEVLNQKDYADVDIRDAAARMGVDPNLPGKAILAMFEQAWADSSLFAGGKNIDLINADAVRQSLAQQDASKSGRQALLAAFGLGDEALQAHPGAQDAFRDLIGIDDAGIVAAGAQARDQFVAGFTSAGTTATNETQGDFLAPIIQSMETSLSAGDVSDRIYAIGGSLVGRIYSGFTDAANNLAWGQPIIDSLASSVAPQVYDMLAAQFDQ